MLLHAVQRTDRAEKENVPRRAGKEVRRTVDGGETAEGKKGGHSKPLKPLQKSECSYL